MLIGGIPNWYRHEAIYSSELLDSFVRGVERQVAESVIRFEKEKTRQEVEWVVGENEEKDARLVETHQGLDDTTWDLSTIFKQYFSNLQRRSALLTLCSYFEHQLDSLCSLYQSTRRYKLAFSDLTGRGIDRSTTFLEKVVGLDALKTSQEWERIKTIQKVRNNIAHRDGKLRDFQGKPVTKAVQAMKMINNNEAGLIGGDEEIELNNGFLSYVVHAYDDYFKLIGRSIEANERELKKESGQRK